MKATRSTSSKFARVACFVSVLVAVPSSLAEPATEAKLEKLEQRILDLGAQKNRDPHNAVADYKAAILLMHKGDTAGKKLIQHLSRWQKEQSLTASVKMSLLLAQIEVADDEKYFPEKPQAAIDAAYAKLTEMDRKEIGSLQLARAMRFLFDRGKIAHTGVLADEILLRKEAQMRDEAMFHKLAVMAESKSRIEQDTAHKGLSEILRKGTPRGYIDGAMLALGKLQIKRKEWAAAEKTFFDYVASPDERKHRGQAWFNLGVARDGQKRETGNKGAWMAYMRVWNKYGADFEYSCPAMLRTLEIDRDRGRPQDAYNMVVLWIRELGKHPKDKFVREYLPKTEAIRDELAKLPGVETR